MIGAQRAAAAAQGLDPDSGSASELTTETHQLGELDTLTLQNNAAREAFGYKVEAAQHKEVGRQSRRAGRSGALTTLLTGAASAWGS